MRGAVGLGRLSTHASIAMLLASALDESEPECKSGVLFALSLADQKVVKDVIRKEAKNEGSEELVVRRYAKIYLDQLISGEMLLDEKIPAEAQTIQDLERIMEMFNVFVRKVR